MDAGDLLSMCYARFTSKITSYLVYIYGLRAIETKNGTWVRHGIVMRVFEIGVVEEERAECVRDGPDKNARATHELTDRTRAHDLEV